jgi:threonine/homoserine/homoserine lactone efflux protein
MIEIPFLLKGALVGFAMAVPVGPVNVLCMRRTLAEGRVAGMVSGLGAAVADGVYGGIAGFGLQFVVQAIFGQQMWFRLFGGAFLCYLGYRTFMAQPHEQDPKAARNGLLGDFLSTFFLTLTNPTTIISFAAVFAAAGIADECADYGSAALLVLGVTLGSSMWWVVLAGIVGVFRSRFNARGLRWVNRISGLVVAGFGLLAMLSFRV